MTFSEKRWPLHFALAWALTRNLQFCERALSTDFAPHLSEKEWKSADEVDIAWEAIFAALRDERVVAYGLPLFRHKPITANEPVRIPVNDLKKMDWRVRGGAPCLFLKVPEKPRPPAERGDPVGYADVAISSSAMIVAFPSGGTPIAFTSKQIGPPKSLVGPGFLPLSDAAYWIATDGGAKDIAGRDTPIWQDAFAELLKEICDGSITVIGRPHGTGTPERIDGVKFSSIPVDYPYCDTPLDMILNDVPHVRCYGPNIGDEWERGFNDALFGGDRDAPEFSHLEVKKADVLQKWPFSSATRQPKGQLGKVPLIKEFFKIHFPKGVPAPSLAPRKTLKNTLLAEEPRLNNSLDEETLAKAIREHNAEISSSAGGPN